MIHKIFVECLYLYLVRQVRHSKFLARSVFVGQKRVDLSDLPDLSDKSDTPQNLFELLAGSHYNDEIMLFLYPCKFYITSGTTYAFWVIIPIQNQSSCFSIEQLYSIISHLFCYFIVLYQVTAF